MEKARHSSIEPPARSGTPRHRRPGCVGLTGWVVDVVARLGYAGVALLLALESIVPPIPSELVLPVAGFAAQEGRLSFWPIVLAATLGATLGALVLYGLARRVGETRTRAFVERHGRWLMMDGEDVDRSRDWFARHGAKAVLLGRLMPGVRSFVSLPAGFARMPLASFVALTFVGSALWNALLVWLGMRLGAAWPVIGVWVDRVGWGIWLTLAAMVGVIVARRKAARRARAA